MKAITYGSICSGIEAASVAWEPLGMRPAWFAEIDPFASAVLAHHWPSVPNLGDFTKIGVEHGPVDLLVGGTPCQAFSVAGKRAGLDDPRGNLTLEYLALADRLRPCWLVWENVPGVLSIDGGRTFGTFLGILGELGYGFAYRVLDAQHFGVPQRRRRVFVVGYLGDWRRAAAVLLERASLCGDPPPSRETGQDVAGSLGAGSGGWCSDTERMTFIPTLAHTLRGEGFDASEDGTGKGTPLVVGTMACNTGPNGYDAGNLMSNQAVDAGYCIPVSVTYPCLRSGNQYNNSDPGMEASMLIPMAGMAVRRLTPAECERLQGFPGTHTLVPYRGKPAADGPRYRAIGNSMAVPVMAWLGRRILAVDALNKGGIAA